MKRSFVVAVFSFVALACLLAACSRPAPPPEPLRAVKTMVIAPASTGGRYEFGGEIRARVESRLGFRVGGKISERRAQIGDRVKAGQVLARLDPSDLRLGQDAARAAVAGAEVNRQQAEADFKRYADLQKQGFISSAELERRETTLKMARTQWQQASAQATMQGNQTGYALLTAGVDGIVTGVEAEAGMVVAAGAPVVRLAHDGPRDVVFSVPEDKVELIQSLAADKHGVELRLWSGTGTPLPASIREVSAAADPVTRTFLVKADVADDARLRLGQTATVSVEAPRVEGIAKLPLSALREERGKSAVWLVDTASMKIVSRAVEVSGVDGGQAIVVAGLATGDRVVTAGVHVLNPGQQVKLYKDPNAPLASASADAMTTR